MEPNDGVIVVMMKMQLILRVHRSASRQFVHRHEEENEDGVEHDNPPHHVLRATLGRGKGIHVRVGKKGFS